MLTRIGDVEIWRILESVEHFMAPQDFFPGMSPEDFELFKRVSPRQYSERTGMLTFPVQGFLLKTPRHVILVDACIGNHKTNTSHAPWHMRNDGRFLAGLTAAGVTPADIDYVMCTHLHPDHVGWNTQLIDGRWVPTFPNARYLMPALDEAHYRGLGSPVYTESVLPVIATGQAELVGADHQLGDYVSLLPTPGHTDGHVSVRITDGGRHAIITGDAIHGTVQCQCPHWNMAFDKSPEQAHRSRVKLLEASVEAKATVLGSHFPLPSIGTVTPSGNAFAWTER